jgi:SAM-dependent methyltransferase
MAATRRRRSLRWLGRIPRDCATYPASAPDAVAWFRRGRRQLAPLEVRQPFINRPARRRLASLVGPGTEVVEVGSSSSTLWLEDRGASVWSLEHDPAWAERVRGELRRPEAVHLVEPDGDGRHRSEATGQTFDSYLDALDGLAPSSADLVIVDGRCRAECVRRLREVVRPGGWLVLDDSQRDRYLPGISLLEGWRRWDAKGFKPPHERTTTSFFQRP